MTLQDFIRAHDGKPVEFEDASNRDQCMDLAFAWMDVLGIPRSTIRNLYAYQAYTNFRANEHLERVVNTPAGVPSPGDLVVWGSAVGVAGHIAIFISGDATHFKSFDQNWPTGSKAHIQEHNYNGVLGWLKPRKLNQGGTMPLPGETALQVEQRLLHGPGGVDEWKVKAHEMRVERDAARTRVVQLEKQVADQQAKVAELEQRPAVGKALSDYDAQDLFNELVRRANN